MVTTLQWGSGGSEIRGCKCACVCECWCPCDGIDGKAPASVGQAMNGMDAETPTSGAQDRNLMAYSP